MTWIKVKSPTDVPEVAEAMKGMSGYPEEYSSPRGERKLPPIVMNDSIVLAHSLIPNVMKNVFAAFGAMMDASLPLSRREHEMIAATVSRLNQCFY